MSNPDAEEVIELENRAQAEALFGSQDANLRVIRSALDVQLVGRNNTLKVRGAPENVQRAARVVAELLEIFHRAGRITGEQVECAVEDAAAEATPFAQVKIDVFRAGGMVRPKTTGQARYVNAIDDNDLVFSIGPAGTGKTYLAVAKAISALKRGTLRRVALVRPAVEAGEKLGFLPGDLQEKVNPYLRPLYDALHDMMDPGHIRRFMENGIIEVIPLAFMRGRTLSNSFVILDEAQNCTIRQMKMFLTRIGPGSKIVVTGDISQGDLPEGEMSGLVHVQHILKGLRGVEFVYLEKADIVRHRLVQDIVRAYEEYESTNRR